jgi:hypothetical protein
VKLLAIVYPRRLTLSSSVLISGTVVATSVVKMSDPPEPPSRLDTAPGSVCKEQEEYTLTLSKTLDVKAPTVGGSDPVEPLLPETPFPEGGLQAWLVVFGAWAGL